MEKIGNIKQAEMYLCWKCNLNQVKKKLKTRVIWMKDEKLLVEHKLIEGISLRVD